MGVVYLASSPAEDVVAVKLIRADLAQDAAFRARFGREVDAARRVGGVCTARVRDADLEGDRPWVVTEFVAGPNLADLVARHGPLPADQQRALAIGLAEALAAVHGAGVVHRDLKPTNVLCSPAGPRLIDFGIAQAADATSATLTGQLVGSPAWMAPEQIRGQTTTPAMDMFALGLVLVFAATGRPPFGDGEMAAVMYRILNEAPDLGPAGALAPELVRLVGALLAKQPASRPGPGLILTDLAGTSADPAQAVTAILDRTWELPAGEKVAIPSAVGRLVAAPPPARPRRWKAVAAALAAVTAVVLVAALLLAKPGKGHNLKADSSSTTAAPLPATTAKADPASTQTTTAPPTTAPQTATTANALSAAQAVEACMSAHGMPASTVSVPHPTQTPPFFSANSTAYARSADSIYSGTSVKVTLFEHCEWPPGPGADQTGYVDTFLTEVPGDASWPGEINPLAQADGIDSSCHRLQILYTGGHTGSSFSDTVVVSSGTLAITQPNWQGLTIPGEQLDQAPNLTEWAQAMGYYLIPGEMAILHADDESASSVDCLA
jgi:serine/threonine protein kinase